MRSVAVTAMGAVTGFGEGVVPFWNGLLSGRSCLGPITLFPTGRVVVRQVAEARPLGQGEPGPAGERAHRLLLAAAREVEAQVPSGLLGGPGTAVVVGTTMGGNRLFCSWLEGGLASPSGSDLASPARLLAERTGAAGPVVTVSAACASGTAALGAAARLVRSGTVDRALAAGVDALSEFVVAGFDSLRALSRTTVRPFDLRRDGLGLGEGAGLLLVEELGAALSRGARPLALVRGYGSAGDAFHMTRPSPRGAGLVRALSAALADARVEPSAIGFVSAHGTGTPLNDAMEAAAFGTVFGAGLVRPPVQSLKGAVGHTLGAAGALEAILTVRVLESGLVPPTAGLEEPDPALGLDVVHGAARRVEPLSLAVSTSSAFAGTNAAVILERA